MTIEQTVEIPVSHRLAIEVPPEVPAGPVVLAFTPITPVTGETCPLYAVYHEPNEETIAAIEEGRAMRRGEIPAKRFHSLDEMFSCLES